MQVLPAADLDLSARSHTAVVCNLVKLLGMVTSEGFQGPAVTRTLIVFDTCAEPQLNVESLFLTNSNSSHKLYHSECQKFFLSPRLLSLVSL